MVNFTKADLGDNFTDEDLKLINEIDSDIRGYFLGFKVKVTLELLFLFAEYYTSGMHVDKGCNREYLIVESMVKGMVKHKISKFYN